MTKRRELGFSLLELVIVLVIALIVTAIAVPSFRVAIDSYRLRASARDVANLLQQARMAAVRANQPVYVQFGPAPNGGNPNPNFAFVALASNPGYAPGDPAVATQGWVLFAPGGGPATGALDAFVGGAPQPPGGTIGFSARGLPCVPTVNPYICAAGAAGFEWFLQSGASQKWAAVTVTPAGRVRTWTLSNGVWQ